MRANFFSCIILAAGLFLQQSGQPGWASETAEKDVYAENGATIWREPLTGMEFVWLAGGCFKMGQATHEKQQLIQEININKYEEIYSDEVPQHEVCLDGFWLGRREVTQGQWLELMNANPFAPGQGKNYPATNISWDMTQLFITELNRKSSGTTFRLPTEAEWEYAARAGTDTPFYTGETITTDQANFNGIHIYGKGTKGIYRTTPLPTGSLPANPFGLFDMAGNLWEWCADRYSADYYKKSPSRNPAGPEEGNQMVMRGGSWFTAPRSIRSANRRGIHPTDALDDFGFRLVCNRPPLAPKKEVFDIDF